MSTGTSLPVLAPILRSTPQGEERERLVRRVRLLARVSLAWHFVEAGVAVGAGVIASSVALIGFGADSLIEAAAGLTRIVHESG